MVEGEGRLSQVFWTLTYMLSWAPARAHKHRDPKNQPTNLYSHTGVSQGRLGDQITQSQMALVGNLLPLSQRKKHTQRVEGLDLRRWGRSLGKRVGGRDQRRGNSEVGPEGRECSLRRKLVLEPQASYL